MEQRRAKLEATELEERQAEERRETEIEMKRMENEAILRELAELRQEAEEKKRVATEQRRAELETKKLEERMAEERRQADERQKTEIERKRRDDEAAAAKALRALEERRAAEQEEKRLAEEQHQAELEKKMYDKSKQRAIYARLVAIVKDRTCNDYRTLLAFRGNNAQTLLNLMQAVRFSPPFHWCYSLRTFQALDSAEVDHSQKGPLIIALIKLSKKSGLYPDCLILSHAATRGSDPIERGSFGDVWKGMICGREVAIKGLRVYLRSDAQKLLKVGFCFVPNVNFMYDDSGILP